MTISNVYLQEETGKQNRQKVFEYTRVYTVSHDASDSTRSILTNASIPQPFEAHPDDANATVRDVSLSRDIGEGKLVSSVTVSYSSEQEREESQEAEDPLARPARISWTTENERVPVTVDKDGDPITNTAGDLLLGVEEDRALWSVTVSRNVSSVPTWLLSYQNAVNSDTVSIGGLAVTEGLLKLDSIEIGEFQFENNVLFYPLTLRMLLRQDGWDQEILNTGVREKKTYTLYTTDPPTEVTELKPILTAEGEPVDEPVFLDSDGKAIRADTGDPNTSIKPLKTDLSAGEIITRTFSTKPSLPFSVLPLS